MLRLGLRTFSLAGALFFLAAAQVSADTAPPPISGGVQPVSASAGSSAQPNSGASVASGRSWVSADGQSADGNTCGATAGAAGSGYAVQPTRAGTSGTSAPNCAAGTAGTGAGSGATAGAPGNGASIGTGGTGTGSGSGASGSTTNGSAAGNSSGLARGLSALGIEGFGNSANGGRGGGSLWPWLLLALLLGVLLFLLGVVVAPRRRRSTNPA